MKNFIKTALFVAIIAFLSTDSNAQIEFKKEIRSKKEITATGFTNYPPFGFIADPNYPDKYESVFFGALNDFFKEWNYETSFVVNKKYDTLVREVRRGDIDLILGIYFETELYEGVEIVYPSIISNPITVIMLPSRINEVKEVSDLKKLKGAVNTSEVFTDHVNKGLKAFNVEKYDNSDSAFKALFTGKADYILSSYYFGLVEASRLGLRRKVSFSKQILWDMPLFFGVSKLSPHRIDLIKALQKMCERPDSKEKIKQYLNQMINEAERRNMGAVPPSYSEQ